MDINEANIELHFQNPKINDTPTVFIGNILLENIELEKLNLKTPIELYIFGALVKTGEIHHQFGEVKRVEFVIIEHNLQTNTIINHYLAQHNTVMYKRENDETAYKCMDMLKTSDILYINKPPRWKASEASIPRCGEKLFYFAKQFYIPKNNTTKTYFTWNKTYYVFLHAPAHDNLMVQIFEQDTSLQTAEDHYKLEGLIADYDRNYKNADIVEKLILRGDNFFHEYVLEHKKTSIEILKILFEFAKTKTMKNEIGKKIRSFQ